MNEVIDKIREKYPPYADVDDLTLTDLVGEKYPAYLSNPSFKRDYDQIQADSKAAAAQPREVNRASDLVRRVGQGASEAAISAVAAVPEIAAQTIEGSRPENLSKSRLFQPRPNSYRAQRELTETANLELTNPQAATEARLRSQQTNVLPISDALSSAGETLRQLKNDQREVYGANPAFDESLLSDIASGVGSSLPTAIVALATGGAALPSYGATALQLYQENFDSALREGKDLKLAHQSGLMALPLAYFEKFGDIRLGNQLRKNLEGAFETATVKAFAKKKVADIALGSLGEGVTEAAQTAGQQEIESTLDVKQRTVDTRLAELGRAFVTGAGAGGAISTAGASAEASLKAAQGKFAEENHLPATAAVLRDQAQIQMLAAPIEAKDVIGREEVQGQGQKEDVTIPKEGMGEVAAAPTAAASSPVPETEQSILKQIEATVNPGTKAVTLITPGSPMPTDLRGLVTAPAGAHGTALYNPAKTTRKAVLAAAEGKDFDGTLLGMSQAAKPEPVGNTVMQTTKDGVPVLDEVVAPTPEAIATATTAHAAAVPGGETTVVPAEKVLEERTSKVQGPTSNVEPNAPTPKPTAAEGTAPAGASPDVAADVPRGIAAGTGEVGVAEVPAVPQWRVNVNTAEAKNVVKTVEAATAEEAEVAAAKLEGVTAVQTGTARLWEAPSETQTEGENESTKSSIAEDTETADGIDQRQEGPAAEEEVAETKSADPAVFTPQALATPQAQKIGVTPKQPKVLTELSEMLGSFLTRKATKERGLPPEAYAAEEAMRGQFSVAEKEIKFAERDLRDALGEVYGIGKLASEAGGLRRIPAEAVLAMNNYLKGELANPEVLPPQVRGALDNMRAIMDGFSHRILTKLEESGGNEQLLEKIKNNLSVYLTRSYRYFDSKLNGTDWYKQIDPVVRGRAEQLLMRNAMERGETMTPERAEVLLLNWLSDLKDKAGAGSGKLGAKDLSLFMKRKQISPEIRAILGEYTDPMINFARSVTKMADWTAKQEFLETVRLAGEGKWLFTDETAIPGFNTRIAAEGSESMNPLNGLRTSPDIAEVFNEFSKSKRDPGLLLKTYLRANALSKVAATTLSLLTHIRNLGGQPWFWGMSGHWHLGNLGTTLKAVAEDLGVRRGDADSKWRAYLKDAAEHGIVGDTARAEELKAIISDAALSDTEAEGLADFSFAKLVKKFAYRIPADIYRLSDELGKIYGWENEKALVRKTHPEWTEAQIKSEAATRVRDQYPTYSRTPPWVKSMRSLPIGPFVSFPYEVLRTSYRAIGRSVQEMRSDNPIEQQIGRKRAASQMITLGAGFALSAVSKAIFGISWKEEEDLRRFQPPWARNAQFLYLSGSEIGTVRFLNLSYQNPYSYLIDPVISGISAVRSDEPFLESVARTTGELFRPYVSEQMLANAMIDVSRNKTETGRPVYNPQDDVGTKAVKVLDHVGMALTPGTLNRLRTRIIPSLSDQQPEYGRKLKPGIEITAELTGLRLEQFDFKNGLSYKASKFGRDVQDAEAMFRTLTTKRGSVSNEELLDGFRDAQGSRFKLWTELRKDYLAALRSGVSTNAAKEVLQDMGLSKSAASAINKGTYNSWTPSDETMGRLKERKKDAPVDEIKEVAKEFSDKRLE